MSRGKLPNHNKKRKRNGPDIVSQSICQFKKCFSGLNRGEKKREPQFFVHFFFFHEWDGREDQRAKRESEEITVGARATECSRWDWRLNIQNKVDQIERETGRRSSRCLCVCVCEGERECVSYRDKRVHRTRWSSENRRVAITRTRQVLRQMAAAEFQWSGRQPAPPLLLLLLKTGTGSRSWPPLGKKGVRSWSTTLFWWIVALRSPDDQSAEAGWTDCGIAVWSTIIFGWDWTSVVVPGAAVDGGGTAARFLDSGESLVP